MDRTWTIVGVGGSPRVPLSGIPGEEDQVGPCEQLDALSPFNPLAKCGKRKENPWTDPIVSTPTMKVVSCVRGELLSIAGLYGRISRGPERRWFTLWRMSAVRVRLSPTRELSRYKAIR
ncbi:unnamed protein product [Dovyalis caffra]|uniref:Uncharacterized protein n=1 Tax=Dovyalis caffra TaxID=77055 RepID=A0AAV1QU61_9ROSI|nr:unnamed protein product [Dovyalis caffra]